MAESLVTKEEEKRLLTTYSLLSLRSYQDFSSALPALKAGRKNFTGTITPHNFPPLSLKARLTRGTPEQFHSTLVNIIIAIISNMDNFQARREFQMARSAVTRPALCSSRRHPRKGGRRCPLTSASLQRCPKEPRTQRSWLQTIPDLVLLAWTTSYFYSQLQSSLNKRGRYPF